MFKIKPVVFIGPPGSGKGTQAKKMAETNSGWFHISTGDLFRAEVKSGSPLGNKVKEILAAGQLVSDDVTYEVFASQTLKIVKEKNPKVLIFDGYPRNAAQVEVFVRFCNEQSNFDIPVSVEFQISEEEIVERLSKRLTNPRSGKIYHEVTNPPQKPMICDDDGGPLERRSDDQPDVIRKRYGIYVKERDAIANGLKKSGTQYQVSAVGKPEKIAEEIKRLLKV